MVDKWTKERCERHFIEDPEGVSIRGLATLSGRSKATIQKWSQEGDWQFKRSEFQKTLTEVSREKTIERISDLLSERNEKLLRRHFEAADQILQIVELRSAEERHRIMEIKRSVEAGKTPRSELLKAVQSINPNHIGKLAESLERLVRLQREAAGLIYYQDLNVSIDALQRAGYVVMERSQFAEVVGEEAHILEAS